MTKTGRVPSRSNVTIRAALYLRVSLDVTGEQLAVRRQREDCLKLAADRGWDVVGEYVDNSISASDRRKDRPAYSQLIDAYLAGEFDALACYDLDRLTRQPRQLEDWIEAAEDRGLVLVTANGEADLTTDAGRLFARIKAAVARAEIERKAARQKRAAAQRAERGKVPGGPRLTGYAPDGSVDPIEAEVVRTMFARFLAGDSLKGIVRWLEDTAPARSGRAWNPSSVRSILLNPRYCGRVRYRGEVLERIGEWEAIVDEATWDLVHTKITDPRRRTQAGTDRKYLGSGLYLCGVCEAPVVAHSAKTYRCAGHVLRRGQSVDDYVSAVVRARLRKPDVADLLKVPESAEAKAAGAEVKRLRARLAAVEADYDAGLIDGRRFASASAKVTAQLEAARAAQVRVLAGAAVASALGARDPVQAFDGAPLMVKRAVIGYLMVVRLLPWQRGVKFRPESVRIVPR